MKIVQFLFLFFLLNLVAGAQEQDRSQHFDFTRFFSADYRHYLKKSRETFNNSTSSLPVVIAIKYGENFASLKDGPITNYQLPYTRDYRYQQNAPSGILQSDIIGTLIKSIIQEKRLQQSVRK